MAMYAIGTLPLIDAIQTKDARQVWYADDSGALGRAKGAREWFGKLQSEGREFGYEVNLLKTVVIVKPKARELFFEAFEGLTDSERGGLRVICGDEIPQQGPEADRVLGHRHLGAGIGTDRFRQATVEKKVEGWVLDLRRLVSLGRTNPQTAFAIFTRCLLPKWRYVMRTTRVPVEVFQPLDEVLLDKFFPEVFGWRPSACDLRRRCQLPTRHGGLGIPVVVELARREWEAGTSLTAVLSEAIQDQNRDYREDPRGVRRRRDERLRRRDKECEAEADDLASRMEGRAARGMEEARLDLGSAWLSFIPLDRLGLDMDSTTFRDAVALRFGLDLPDKMPRMCPSCGGRMSVAHALKCKKGGWVIRRHQHVLRAWKAYWEKAGLRPVFEEPYLVPVRPGVHVRPGTTTAIDARADLVVRGLHGTGDTFADIVVVDTGADSYKGRATMKILGEHERRKRREYGDRVSPYGTFVPLVCSVYGTLGVAAAQTSHRAARRVEGREERDAALDLHRVVLQAAIIKATSLCLRARSWLTQAQPTGPLDLEDAPQQLADAGWGSDEV